MNPIPYDPALAAALGAVPSYDTVEKVRKVAAAFPIEEYLQKLPDYERTDHTIPGPKDNTTGNVILTVFKPKTPSSRKLPACYHIHGGGQVAGHRLDAIHTIFLWFKEIEMVHISVEYRLAPEHPAPAGLNDCFTGLVWTITHSDELGFDTSKLMIEGTSGGSPLTAACAIKARNHQYPPLCGQILSTPMLDDRLDSVSAKQYYDNGPLSTKALRTIWDCVLGSDKNSSDISELISPARATNLEGVAPALIDAGEAEVFRDEAVAYASVLWKSGVSAELHIWPGAYHGFDFLVPQASVSLSSVATRKSWIRRRFGIAENSGS